MNPYTTKLRAAVTKDGELKATISETEAALLEEQATAETLLAAVDPMNQETFRENQSAYQASLSRIDSLKRLIQTNQMLLERNSEDAVALVTEAGHYAGELIAQQLNAIRAQIATVILPFHLGNMGSAFHEAPRTPFYVSCLNLCQRHSYPVTTVEAAIPQCQTIADSLDKLEAGGDFFSIPS